METTQKAGMGCWLKGCLVLLVVGAVLGLVAGWGAYSVYKKVAGFVSSEPASLPPVKTNQEKYEEVRNRIRDFQKNTSSDIRSHLELTADDVNTYIAYEPGLADLRGRFFLRIEDGSLLGDVSIPLEKLLKMKGKFVNGTVGLKASISEGREFNIALTSLKVNGKEPPAEFMKPMSDGLQQGINDKLRENSEFRAVIAKVKSFRVEGDRIILEAGSKDATTSAGSAVVEEEKATIPVSPSPQESSPSMDTPIPERNNPAGNGHTEMIIPELNTPGDGGSVTNESQLP